MKSPFEWDIVTRGLVAMTVEGFVGFLLTIMCRTTSCSRSELAEPCGAGGAWGWALPSGGPRRSGTRRPATRLPPPPPPGACPCPRSPWRTTWTWPAQRQRVLRGDADNDMVKIENLTKAGPWAAGAWAGRAGEPLAGRGPGWKAGPGAGGAGGLGQAGAFLGDKLG